MDFCLCACTKCSQLFETHAGCVSMCMCVCVCVCNSKISWQTYCQHLPTSGVSLQRTSNMHRYTPWPDSRHEGQIPRMVDAWGMAPVGWRWPVRAEEVFITCISIRLPVTASVRQDVLPTDSKLQICILLRETCCLSSDKIPEIWVQSTANHNTNMCDTS